MKEKMKKMKNIILTDCDGVLLDWENSFHDWMYDNGYKKVVEGVYEMEVAYDISKAECKKLVKEFNQSAWMCCLPALRDARSGVAKLVEAGYTFTCITSLSLDVKAQMLRISNLKNIFGKNVFIDVICLDTGADKDDALEPYRDSGCYWIEDKPKNVDLGCSLGLRGILIAHDYNTSYTKPDTIPVIQPIDTPAVRVQNWKEIYEMLV